MKLSMNQLIASLMTAFAQSLTLVQKSGIPVETFMGILRQSVLFAPMFEKKLPRLLTRDYANPNFSTKHMLKDVDLFLSTFRAHNCDTTGLEGIKTLLEKTVKTGKMNVDYSALFESVNLPGVSVVAKRG